MDVTFADVNNLARFERFALTQLYLDHTLSYSPKRHVERAPFHFIGSTEEGLFIQQLLVFLRCLSWVKSWVCNGRSGRKNMESDCKLCILRLTPTIYSKKIYDNNIYIYIIETEICY